MAERILTLYATYAYKDEYFELSPEDQVEFRRRLSLEANQVAEATHLYSVFPTRVEADFMVWSTWAGDELDASSIAFKAYANVSEGWRKYVKAVHTFWGFTKPSTYSRGKSEQDLDPLEGKRSSYLTVYPFSKTKDWYIKSMDSRQGMMNEHIKLGKQYFDIKQLLIYSFGIQDQEFVVSYEMEDLTRFSELVNALRGTEARLYTLLDTPLITGLYLTEEEFVRG